jgi:ketosteroid isomerase-like protein
MSHYVPDDSLLVFDMMTPREYRGAKALRKDWETFLSDSVQSIEVCDISELAIDVSSTLATSHYIEHAQFTDKVGHKGMANARMTHIFRKTKGKWLIIHEHASYPIDWKTGLGDLLSAP